LREQHQDLYLVAMVGYGANRTATPLMRPASMLTS